MRNVHHPRRTVPVADRLAVVVHGVQARAEEVGDGAAIAIDDGEPEDAHRRRRQPQRTAHDRKRVLEPPCSKRYQRVAMPPS
jgi:hypothetical protein